jgi:hypothetical protein
VILASATLSATSEARLSASPQTRSHSTHFSRDRHDPVPAVQFCAIVFQSLGISLCCGETGLERSFTGDFLVITWNRSKSADFFLQLLRPPTLFFARGISKAFASLGRSCPFRFFGLFTTIGQISSWHACSGFQPLAKKPGLSLIAQPDQRPTQRGHPNTARLTALPLYPLHIPVRLGDPSPPGTPVPLSLVDTARRFLACKPLRHASTGLPTPPAEDAHQGTHAATKVPFCSAFPSTLHFAEPADSASAPVFYSELST